MSGRWILTTTAWSLSRARCTCPSEAEASGSVLEIREALPRRERPSSRSMTRRMAEAVSGATSSCRPASSAVMTSGSTSTRADRNWPDLDPHAAQVCRQAPIAAGDALVAPGGGAVRRAIGPVRSCAARCPRRRCPVPPAQRRPARARSASLKSQGSPGIHGRDGLGWPVHETSDGRRSRKCSPDARPGKHDAGPVRARRRSTAVERLARRRAAPARTVHHLVSSATSAGTNTSGRISSHCAQPRVTVLKIGCRNGR